MSLASAIGVYQTMFLYSGVDKINHFDKKVATLIKKLQERLSLQISPDVARLGMGCVILLEIVGSLVLIAYAIMVANGSVPTWMTTLANITILSFIIFILVVTYVYHPFGTQKIPFLSNLTTAAGFVLMSAALTSGASSC